MKKWIIAILIGLVVVKKDKLTELLAKDYVWQDVLLNDITLPRWVNLQED